MVRCRTGDRDGPQFESCVVQFFSSCDFFFSFQGNSIKAENRRINMETIFFNYVVFELITFLRQSMFCALNYILPKGVTSFMCSSYIFSCQNFLFYLTLWYLMPHQLYWQLEACLHFFSCVNVSFQNSYELVPSIFKYGIFSV